MLLRYSIIILLCMGLLSCSFEEDRDVSIVPTQRNDINISPSSSSTSTRTSTSSSTSTITQNWIVIHEINNYVSLTGQLTENGIYIGDKNSYVEYSTLMRQAILIEFDVVGLRTVDINNEEEVKLVFIQVYDGAVDTVWVGGSSVWSTQHLIEVRKKNAQLRMKGGGGCEDCYDIETYIDSQEWNPLALYHFILKIESGTVFLYQNEILIYEGTSTYFVPSSTLNVRIGGGRSDLGIPQVYYSNIKIYGKISQ